MAIFTGAGVALITPMNDDGSVNYEKLRELLEFHVANKTDASLFAEQPVRHRHCQMKNIWNVFVLPVK